MKTIDPNNEPRSTQADRPAPAIRKIFDYRALRLVVGILAFALPILVMIRSTQPLTSISGSYYSEARDIFVGILFFIAAFLFAYKGDYKSEARASTIACLAAIVVACFPTSEGCGSTAVGTIHFVAAAVLFLILAYFCFVPFRKRVKHESGTPRRRSRIYFGCGIVIVAALIFAFVTGILMPCETSKEYAFIFWAEFVALWAFGVAWIVSGKVIPGLVDEKERLHIVW